MGWCIAQALSHPHSEDLLIQKWLRNDHVSKFISEIVDKELADECPPELGVILKLVFTENSNGGRFCYIEKKTFVFHELLKFQSFLLAVQQ